MPNGSKPLRAESVGLVLGTLTCGLLLQAVSRGEAAMPKARLHFAHAETLLPLTSLLGLFGAPGPIPCTGSPPGCRADSMTGEEASDDICPTDW